MRTDSVAVSNDALDEVRAMITDRWGAEYRPASPNIYKGKKDAQDAHEAVRPTSAMRTPESVEKFLAEDELKLYRLIWMRFVASQMTPAVFDQTTIDVDAKARTEQAYLVPRHRKRSQVRRIPQGLSGRQRRKRRRRRRAEEQAPACHAGEVLKFKAILPEQHFTEPPPRVHEATLVKELEAKGVGRPSDLRFDLSTIQERNTFARMAASSRPPSSAWW
jgi:DNA topoisomerase-1